MKTMTTTKEMPNFVTFKGRTYCTTGKEGVNIKTGLACKEYSYHPAGIEYRVWLLENGTMIED